MANPQPKPRSRIKRILPQSLFGRALLILVVPTILIQLLATHVFYDRHWDNVSRWMARSLAGDVALLVHELNDDATQQERQDKLIMLADRLMSMKVWLEEKQGAEKFLRSGKAISPIFYRELEARLNLPFSLSLEEEGNLLHIRVKLEEEILHIRVTRKRLVSATTYIFVMWMFGSTVVLLGVAVMFLRNQIRPISKLATAMEAFGKGQDIVGFRPQGAVEVRRAGRAFLQMKQRIERQISARMEMLAGISHDLRTPLTRLRLQAEMLKEKEAAKNLQQDVTDMEHMITEYLDFVRGEGLENLQMAELNAILEDIVSRYKQQQKPVKFAPQDMQQNVELRPLAFQRVMTNLIDNALRYGEACDVSWMPKQRHVAIYVDDSGPGIPETKREDVFKPFKRLDGSRNSETGGVGLGLTIARDIVHAHGGDIVLKDRPGGKGLRVIIRLPLP